MKVIVRVLTVLIAAGVCFGSDKPGLIPANSNVFIAPMQGDLEGFIATELIKQRVPVNVVLEETDADYVLVGTSIKADDKWYNTVFNGKDKNEGNVRLLDKKNKRMIWAGEAGDRSLWLGNWSRGGERKVATRLWTR